MCILWDYILVLIYIWLITKDVEYFFMCLVALRKSFLLKYLFKCSACFSLSFWSFLLNCPQQSLIILLMAVVSLMISFPFIIFTVCLFVFFFLICIGGGGGSVVKSCPILTTPWTVACQAPLFMRLSRQE